MKQSQEKQRRRGEVEIVEARFSCGSVCICWEKPLRRSVRYISYADFIPTDRFFKLCPSPHPPSSTIWNILKIIDIKQYRSLLLLRPQQDCIVISSNKIMLTATKRISNLVQSVEEARLNVFEGLDQEYECSSQWLESAIEVSLSITIWLNFDSNDCSCTNQTASVALRFLVMQTKDIYFQWISEQKENQVIIR